VVGRAIILADSASLPFPVLFVAGRDVENQQQPGTGTEGTRNQRLVPTLPMEMLGPNSKDQCVAIRLSVP
jgi:hypothetical protein